MSLMIVWGKEIDRKKVKEDDAKRYCESVGAKFIRLRLRGSAEQDIYGFQAAYFTIRPGKSGAQIIYQPMVGPDGKPRRDATLSFSKDDLGICWAELPDFEHNIKVLAGCMINGSDQMPITGYEIVNKDDRQRVEDYMNANWERFGWTKDKIKEEKAQRFNQDAPKIADRPKVVVEPPEVKKEEFKSGEITAPVEWKQKRKYTRKGVKDTNGHTNTGDAA